MGIFNINATDHGKVFIVRPLLNAKNLKENIVSYYRFDNTIEKQTYIENLLTTTELDLSEELKQVKSKIGYREIKFPNGSVKKLQEIYESEDLI